MVGCGLERPKEKGERCGQKGKADYFRGGADPFAQFCAAVGGVGPLRAHGAKLGCGICVFVHASVD